MLRKFYSNSTGAVLIIVALIALGIAQFLGLPIALYPNTSKPEIMIGMDTASMSAGEFKERYASDLESGLLAIDKAEKVRGRYRNGYIRIWVEFDWGVDGQKAKTDVQSVFEGWTSRFPREFSKPWYWFEGGGGGRVLASIKTAKFDAPDLEKILEKSLVPKLQQVEGLERGGVWRLYKQQVMIEVNPAKVNQFGIAYKDVINVLRQKEFDQTLGKLDLKAGGEYQVQAKIKSKDIDRLKEVIVGYVNKRPVRLTDIASVGVEDEELEKVSRGNGERKVLIVGNPKPDANLRNFADDFLQTVTAFGKSLDPNVEIDVLMNPSTFINEAVSNVVSAVVIGMGVATLIIFLFLTSFRNTIVIGVTIPLSLISGFILMKVFGIGVNLISLGGMALAVGMVVDGSIVVLENIVRHFEIAKPQSYDERLSVIIEATREVRLPIIASLLTTIIVFAPLPFTSPLASAILGDLAVVMVCVLTVSIAVTLIILPAIVLMLGIGNLEKKATSKDKGAYVLSAWFKRFFSWLSGTYYAAIEKFLRRRKWRISVYSVVALAILASGWIVTTQLEREIMGTPDTDKLYLWLNLKEDYPIEVAEEIAGEFEMGVHEHFKDYIKFTYAEVNQDSSFILAILKDKRDVKTLKKKFEDHFKSTPEARVYVGTWTPTKLRIPNPPVIEASVAATTDEERRNILEDLREAVRDVENAGRKKTIPRLKKNDFLSITPDEKKLKRVRSAEWPDGDPSFTENRLFSHVGGFLYEKELMEIVHAGEEIPVRVRMPKSSIRSPEDVGNLLVRAGQKIYPVKTFAKIEHNREYSEFQTENAKEIAMLRVWPKESYEGKREDLRKDLMEAFKKSEEVDLSRVSFGDTDTEIDENINSLVSALAIAVLLIGIVITLQFGTMIRALIVMLAIPLGFIGVSSALWVFSSPLNVNSMLGLILLCGTAVNNSIIFLDFYVRIRERHPDEDVTSALLRTAKVRFRPIMITTMTTILGMLPIAIGYGSGGEILQPLGIAVCGGLGVSTFLTLVCLPLAIQAVESLRAKFTTVQAS